MKKTMKSDRKEITMRSSLQNQDEEAVRNQFEFSNYIIDKFPHPIFLKRIDGIYIGCNKAFTDFLGLPRDKVIGERDVKIFEMVSEKDLMGVYADKDKELFKNPGIQICELKYCNKEGIDKSIVHSAITFNNLAGEVAGLIGIIVDVSGQRAAENELIEKDYHIRQLTSLTNEAIIVFDIETMEIIETNEISEKLYGYTSEEFKKMNILDIFNEKDLALASIKDVINNNLDRIDYRYHLKKNGTIFSAEVITSSFKKNNKLFLCCMIHDIITRREVEEQLLNYDKQLQVQQQSLQEKDVAFRELMSQIDAEKNDIIQRMMINIDLIINPIIHKLKLRCGTNCNELIQQLKNGLDEVSSPFLSKLSQCYASLTPREIEVCRLIKLGMSSKDIAFELDTSLETIRNHRKSIRRKLEIANQDVNLISFLKTID